jgi:hypothetical protein
MLSFLLLSSLRRKQPSPEPLQRRDLAVKPEASMNGKWSGPSHASEHDNFSAPSPTSPDFDDDQDEDKMEQMDRRCFLFLVYEFIFVLKTHPCIE